MVAGSKAQEERDTGRLSAGREVPVIANGDGEQERYLRWKRSAYFSWHRKTRRRRCTLSRWGSTHDCNHCWIIIRLRRLPNIDIMHCSDKKSQCTHIAFNLLTVVSRKFRLLHPERQISLASSFLHCKHSTTLRSR